MLFAHNLGKRYGVRTVFRGVEFALEAGTVAAVIGSNGAGKSTLLKVVAGLTPASAGLISWGDDSNSAGSLKGKCGLSAPDAPLYRELTAVENLEFFAGAKSAVWSTDNLLAHLDRFQLRARHDDLTGDLSSGLRARLQLAVAVLHNPPVLLLDEPSANLDEAGRAIFRDVLEAQRARGVALVATNDARDVELCDTRIEL
jgi:heme exporter protein A